MNDASLEIAAVRGEEDSRADAGNAGTRIEATGGHIDRQYGWMIKQP